MTKYQKLDLAIKLLSNEMPIVQAYAHAFGYVSSMLTDEQVDMFLKSAERKTNV